ncbi:MAG: putative hydrolase of the superfamily [Clostridiales bacterium]|nr:putative hydrolase of the superfamily [Clostridiales bacterium]
MSISALIFDLDDTLYDEIDYVYSGFNNVAKKIASDYGLDSEKVNNALTVLFEQDRRNVFDRLITQLGISCNADYIAEIVAVYRDHRPHISLRQDARAVLDYASEAGYKKGLITDGDSKRQRAKLRALGIEHLFDAIIISGENPGSVGKPNTYPYKKCLALLDVAPDEAVYIADNPAKDFIGAKALGVKTVRFVNERGLYRYSDVAEDKDADYVINDLCQLIYIIVNIL